MYNAWAPSQEMRRKSRMDGARCTMYSYTPHAADSIGVKGLRAVLKAIVPIGSIRGS